MRQQKPLMDCFREPSERVQRVTRKLAVID
uniref:Uncharacterized protein n=1 Tax=Anguilla anguilla TaxID=7936 RepID=A0A0E9TTS2_ANGAN